MPGKLSRGALRRSLAFEPLEARDLLSVARIIGGVPTTGFAAVGQVGDPTGFYASGTLVAPQYVLTAAHVAEGLGNTTGRFRLGSTVFTSAQVFVHSGYRPDLLGTDLANDIALMKLSRPVTTVTPLPIHRAEPLVGQTLTLVGFGGGGTAAGGTDGSFGVKRVGTTPIEAVTPKLIEWDFDHATEANTAPGDSGGPGLLSLGGVYYVAGVTSGGDRADAALGDHSFDTRVDAYAAWIDSIVASGAVALPTLGVVASDASAAEAARDPGVFTFSRSGSTTAALVVRYAVSGTATAGADFARLSGSVVIGAGRTSATVRVTPIDDRLAEAAENVVVTISAAAAYQVDPAAAAATVSLADNDLVVRPANDLFVNRAVLSDVVSGSNLFATREAGEPINAAAGGKSVWWTWTAPATGRVTIDTAGSSFDTTLGVYTGAAVNRLTRVAANDDSGLAGDATSRVSFLATLGQRYQISVDGYRGATGNIQLHVVPAVRTVDRSLLAAAVDGYYAATPAGGTQAGIFAEAGGGRWQWWPRKR